MFLFKYFFLYIIILFINNLYEFKKKNTFKYEYINAFKYRKIVGA